MQPVTLRKSRPRSRLPKPKLGLAGAKKINVRRMLVPVDFSKPSLDAIDYATRIATRLGAELSLIHVFETQYPLVGMDAMPIYIPDPDIEVRAREHLRTIAKDRGISTRAEHIHVRNGRPFEEICRLATETGIDLIIIPTRGNTGLKHLMLGSTAERVVRYSPCPVLVFRSVPKGRRNGKLPAASITFRRIVVPTDFSDSSMKALNYAKELARKFKAKLILSHSIAMQYFLTSDEYAAYDLPFLMRQAETLAHRQMRDLVAQTKRDGTKVKSSMQIGHAGQEICASAEAERADLIVTATHGLTGLKRLLLGSTAEYVVRHATCPVLVIPTRSTQPI